MTTLFVLLVISILCFYGAVMVLWWHENNEQSHENLDIVTMRQIGRIIRMTRRSYYAGALYSRRFFSWGNKSLGKAFVHVFPKSRGAFDKRNIMQGLEHGASSYYLHSISSSKSEVPKPKIRRKKIVA